MMTLSRRRVNHDRNSTCGSARLADLDWSRWFTDGGPDRLYLHVWHKDGETIHRVYCRRSIVPRLSCDGELLWLIDKKPATVAAKRRESAEAADEIARLRALLDSEFGAGWEDFDRAKFATLRAEIAKLRETNALMQGVLRQIVDRNLQYVDGRTTLTVERGVVLAARNFV